MKREKIEQAYLNFGGPGTAEPNGPRCTVEVEARRTEPPRSGQTRTGYGRRMPTSLQVKWCGRWRRVYVVNYSNSGTAYIGPRKGPWLATVSTF